MADMIKVYQPTHSGLHTVEIWVGLGWVYLAERIYYRCLENSAIELTDSELLPLISNLLCPTQSQKIPTLKNLTQKSLLRISITVSITVIALPALRLFEN